MILHGGAEGNWKTEPMDAEVDRSSKPTRSVSFLLLS